jgi:hypothetical protein
MRHSGPRLCARTCRFDSQSTPLRTPASSRGGARRYSDRIAGFRSSSTGQSDRRKACEPISWPMVLPRASAAVRLFPFCSQIDRIAIAVAVGQDIDGRGHHGGPPCLHLACTDAALQELVVEVPGTPYLIIVVSCRVEVWRGGLGRCLCSLLTRSFVCGCHPISTMLRFHTPLIKPGRRFSRTRLSDKAC